VSNTERGQTPSQGLHQQFHAYADFAESEWDRAYLSAEMALQRAPSEAEVEMELLRLFAQLGAKVEASEHG